MALLAAITVYAEAHLGVVALALLVALFFLYLHLLRELTLSQERSEELQRPDRAARRRCRSACSRRCCARW